MRRSNRGSRGSSHNRMNYAYATLHSFRQELFTILCSSHGIVTLSVPRAFTSVLPKNFLRVAHCPLDNSRCPLLQ